MWSSQAVEATKAQRVSAPLEELASRSSLDSLNQKHSIDKVKPFGPGHSAQAIRPRPFGRPFVAVGAPGGRLCAALFVGERSNVAEELLAADMSTITSPGRSGHGQAEKNQSARLSSRSREGSATRDYPEHHLSGLEEASLVGWRSARPSRALRSRRGRVHSQGP
jgi:hypothetical protein